MDEITRLVTDGKHGDCSDEHGSGYFFLSSKDLRDGRLQYDSAREIARDDFLETHRRTNLEPGDILLTNCGASIGRVGLAHDDPRIFRTTFQKSISVIKANPALVDNKYLYYFLHSNSNLLIKLADGTAQPNLLIRDLKRIEVPLPDLSEQREIAEVLSAYDQLIELNKRRIEVLEAIALTLYREWFELFRFTNSKNYGFRQTTFGRIPSGWELLPMKALGRIVLGGTPSRAVKAYWENGTIPWLKSGKLNELRVTEGTELITIDGLRNSAAKIMPPKTVLIAITGAILISFLEVEACANQSVVGIHNLERIGPEYLHLFLKKNIALLESKMSGSAQQHINKEIVEQTLVLVPDPLTAQKTNTFLSGLYEEIVVLLRYNAALDNTRRLLVARLLSRKGLRHAA